MSIRVLSLFLRNKRASLGLVATLGLGNVVGGCAPTEDGGSNNMGGLGAAAGMGAPPAMGTGNFSGTVVESVNDNPIPSSQLGLTVTALNNETGEPLPGKQTMTNESAAVAFTELPLGDVGFKITGVPAQAIDTYTFNVDSSTQNKLLRVVAKSSVLTVKTVANVTLNPDMADAAGAVYWINGAGQEEPVGCVTVAIDDGVGDIRYFASNNLPTTNVALESAPFLEVRTATNPLNGKFYIANTTPGRHTITAMLNGQVIGMASLPTFQGRASTDGENAISLTDITVSGPANPTPPGCM